MDMSLVDRCRFQSSDSNLHWWGFEPPTMAVFLLNILTSTSGALYYQAIQTCPSKRAQIIYPSERQPSQILLKYQVMVLNCMSLLSFVRSLGGWKSERVSCHAVQNDIKTNKRDKITFEVDTSSRMQKLGWYFRFRKQQLKMTNSKEQKVHYEPHYK